jgi:hypothetical protein
MSLDDPGAEPMVHQLPGRSRMPPRGGAFAPVWEDSTHLLVLVEPDGRRQRTGVRASYVDRPTRTLMAPGIGSAELQALTVRGQGAWNGARGGSAQERLWRGGRARWQDQSSHTRGIPSIGKPHICTTFCAASSSELTDEVPERKPGHDDDCGRDDSG